MSAARYWLSIGVACGTAVLAGQPPAPQPPAAASGPAPVAAGTPSQGAAPEGAGDTGAVAPDEDFIEFLGADDDAVRWQLKNSAPRQGRPPATPSQDANP